MEKDCEESIIAANEAWKKYLTAADNYTAATQELRAEKEYLSALQAGEEDTEK